MSRILVTGGGGALGTALISHLNTLGNVVMCGTRSAALSATTCRLDVTDAAQVADVISECMPDIIVHLAATFVNDYDAAYAINVLGARNILTAVRETGRPIRVVLSGSAAEYGVVEPDDNPVRVDQQLRPVSIYGLTKSWQTGYGLMCAHQGMDVVVARIFNLEGPGLSDRLFVGRIDRQIREIVAGERERIEIGPLSAHRDYIALDAAALQLAAIMDQGISGNVYHVASGHCVQMRELLKRQLAAHGLNFNIVDEAQALSSRVGYDVPVIYADISGTVGLMNE